MKKILILFIFWHFSMSGQYQAAHWFFGQHAGLDFTNGFPVSETGGMIDSEEGISSISNACGDLQFYTDGITLWNANHAVMPLGTGLKGDDSSTQSAIIIPAISQDNIYYVFTADDGFSAPSLDGINYTVVDMSLDNGLGNVAPGQKNISLINHASEKITAVSTPDGTAVWVVFFAPETSDTSAPYNTTGNNFNTFYAFKITASGILYTATVSNFPNLHITNGIGYMKLSPNGQKIAIANSLDNSAYIFDFNTVTGEITNPVSLPLTSISEHPYGLEFSPDSSKLYISDWYNTLTQFDLNNNYNATIISTNANYRAALQLGLDGKIYRPYTTDYGSTQTELSVINNPNEAGMACDYQHRSINLGSGLIVHQGLPNFMASYFNSGNIGSITHNQQFTQYEITANEPFNSVDWDFGDGTTLTTYPDNPPDNTHTSANHTYASTGVYNISAVLHYTSGCDVPIHYEINTAPNGIKDTIWNNIHIYPNPANHLVNINLHGIENAQITIMDLSGKAIYHTFVGRAADSYQINVSNLSGIYFLKISNEQTQKTFKLIVKH